MSSLRGVSWSWCARTEEVTGEAVTPRAAVGHGVVASRLLRRLLAVPAPGRSALTATASADWLIVLGLADDLPWVEGVRYAAPCAASPALWLPTHVQPTAPADLLGRALQARHGRAPLLLWPDPAAVLPLDRQLPASDALLGLLATHLHGAARF